MWFIYCISIYLWAAISTAELAAVYEGGWLTGLRPDPDVGDGEGGGDGLLDQLGLAPVPVYHHKQHDHNDRHHPGHHPGGNVDAVSGLSTCPSKTLQEILNILKTKYVQLV